MSKFLIDASLVPHSALTALHGHPKTLFRDWTRNPECIQKRTSIIYKLLSLAILAAQINWATVYSVPFISMGLQFGSHITKGGGTLLLYMRAFSCRKSQSATPASWSSCLTTAKVDCMRLGILQPRSRLHTILNCSHKGSPSERPFQPTESKDANDLGETRQQLVQLPLFIILWEMFTQIADWKL